MNQYKWIIVAATSIFTTILLAGCGSHGTIGKSDAESLWKADDKQDKIVVISDLHLGIQDEYTETLENRPRLVEFLQRLQNTKDVRELVIAGDFLDEWFLPVSYPSYTDEKQFYKDVIANNQDVIDELIVLPKVALSWFMCRAIMI